MIGCDNRFDGIWNRNIYLMRAKEDSEILNGQRIGWSEVKSGRCQTTQMAISTQHKTQN